MLIHRYSNQPTVLTTQERTNAFYKMSPTNAKAVVDAQQYGSAHDSTKSFKTLYKATSIVDAE